MARNKVDPHRLLQPRKNMHVAHKDLTEEKKIDRNINAYKELLDPLMPQETRSKMREQYTQFATSEEQLVIADVLGYLTKPEDVAHFMMGAHIQLEGQDIAAYKKWHNKFAEQTHKDGTVTPAKLIYRSSSHVTVDKQWGLNGKVTGHILCGTRYEDTANPSKGKYTWVQLENNPIGGFKEFKKTPISFIISAILHFCDFLNYRITGRNIGRWGASKYTEKNPLKIDTSGTTPEMAVERSKVWQEVILDRGGNINDPAMLARMRKVGIEVPATFAAKPELGGA